MLWQRTNAQGLITKLLKVIRIVNALNLRKFNNPTSRFELNPSSANPTKWPNTLQQFVGKLPKNCLSVFGHFVGLALKGLKSSWYKKQSFDLAITKQLQICNHLPKCSGFSITTKNPIDFYSLCWKVEIFVEITLH